jgi:hypothetical protein
MDELIIPSVVQLNMVLSAVGAYGVDAVRKRSAEVMAANA